MPEIHNFTGQLERAEAFLRAKCELIATDGLSIHIKFTRARGRDLNGYYRTADRRIVLAVKKRLRYPRTAAYGVGSISIKRRTSRSRPFRLVWHEDRFDSPEDLLAFVAGHEMWHFLCDSGQRKGDHETKANCNGFLWLYEYRRWPGPGHPVEAIPIRPPRPDRIEVAVATAVRAEPRAQGELFNPDVAAGTGEPRRPRPSGQRRESRPETRSPAPQLSLGF